MKKSLVLSAVMAAALFAGAQKKNTPEFFANTITAKELSKHLHIIAGPEMEGRNTPSAGLDKAAEYIINHFKAVGVAPGNNGEYRQYFPLYKDEIVSSTISVNNKNFQQDADFQPGTRNYNAEFRIGEVLFAGYGIVDSLVDDYKGLPVTGRFVVILDGAPDDYKPAGRMYRNAAAVMAKINAAAQKGAAGVILVDSRFPKNAVDNSNAPYALSNFARTVAPYSFTISEKVAEEILGVKNVLSAFKGGNVAKKGYAANIVLSTNKKSTTAQTANVVGIIEGSEIKDEYVVISAHYDHDGIKNGQIYYGADDDGSGTVAILQIAEAFAKAKAAGKGPKRTVIFLLVAGEEKGLWGSAFYANNPIFPLEKTSANINIDMIGRVGDHYIGSKDSSNYIYVIGDEKLSSDLEPIQNKANKSVKLILDRRFSGDDPNRYYYRSDHYNFAIKGVPAIFYFNGTHPDYHRPTDTPDKINYPLMEKRSRLAFLTINEIANFERLMKRDRELVLPGR